MAQASFDAWVKYYRQDENTANATVSYYTKGALVALCFDLALRKEGKTTLDAVMRALWQRCKAGPMTEADFAAVLKELGGRAFSREIAAWVHGTRELPLEALLQPHGVAVLEEPAQLQQRLGLRMNEATPLQIKTVLRGGAAEQAGLAANDEWLGVEVAGTSWRMTKLDDLPFYAGGPQEGHGAGGARPPAVAAGAQPAGRGHHLAAGPARPGPGPAVAGGASLSPGLGRRLLVLLALVLLAHALALDWLAHQLEQASILRAMPAPMLTRLLQPEAPVTPAPAPPRPGGAQAGASRGHFDRQEASSASPATRRLAASAEPPSRRGRGRARGRRAIADAESPRRSRHRRPHPRPQPAPADVATAVAIDD